MPFSKFLRIWSSFLSILLASKYLQLNLKFRVVLRSLSMGLIPTVLPPPLLDVIDGRSPTEFILFDQRQKYFGLAQNNYGISSKTLIFALSKSFRSWPSLFSTYRRTDPECKWGMIDIRITYLDERLTTITWA